MYPSRHQRRGAGCRRTYQVSSAEIATSPAVPASVSHRPSCRCATLRPYPAPMTYPAAAANARPSAGKYRTGSMSEAPAAAASKPAGKMANRAITTRGSHGAAAARNPALTLIATGGYPAKRPLSGHDHPTGTNCPSDAQPSRDPRPPARGSRATEAGSACWIPGDHVQRMHIRSCCPCG
jgi:hypothetical protein